MHFPAPLPEILTVKEVADYLRVTPTTVYRMITDGRLATVRMGRSYRIPRATVEALLKPVTTKETSP